MTEALYISFVILLAAALLVPSAVFLAMSFSHREMRYWRLLAFGYGSLFLASILAASRDFIPNLASIPISNMLVGVGYFICLRAFKLLDKKRVWNHADVIILSLYSIAVFLVYFLSNEYSLRVTLVSACICFYSLLLARVVLITKRNLSALGAWLVLTASAINITLSGMRTIAAWLNSENYLLSLELWDTVFFIGSIGVLFSFSIGQFIIGSSILTSQTNAQLAHERNLTAKLNDALEDQKNLQKLLIHEIKRPINAISATLQSQKKEVELQQNSSTHASLLQLINEATTSLEQIGEYDELSSLFEQPKFAEIQLGDIVKDLRSKWRVDVSIEKHLWTYRLNVDPFLLDVALGNLIENGQKFGLTPEGVLIRIIADAGYAAFDIEDDGQGIPENEWSRVWGKFYRVGHASQNAIKGCGLGLHAVRQIAVIHHGYVSVMSKSPSTIRFAIPISQEVSDCANA